MGKRGPKPQPGSLKRLRGNPGKRKIEKDIADDENYPKEVPEPPDTLNVSGKAEWKRLAPILHKLKMLSVLDVVALEIYCKKFIEWREAEAQISKYGTVIKSPNGFPQVSPYMSIARNALADMFKLMCEFGMTPSKRTQFHVQGKEKEGQEEEIESFLKAGKKLRAVK